MSELKTCPFCGSKAINMMGYNYHKVCCSSDDCEINQAPFTREAWNARAPQSEWISVDDRLPNLNEYVLVFDGSELWIDFMCKSHGDCRKCFASVEYGATHWMPLPTLPEAK